MRRVLWLLAVGVVVVALGGLAQAEIATGQVTQIGHPTLSVGGSGTVQVPPDTVRVAASVITEAPTVAEARDRNAEIATRAMEAVKALKLKNVTSKTVDYTMERVSRDAHLNMKADLAKLEIPWRNVTGIADSGNFFDLNFPVTLGYKATNSVTVRVQGLSADDLSASASKIIDALMAAGCNQITSVTYSLEQDPNTPRREALAKAVKEAQLTAKTAAEAAGRTIVGIRSINPSYYGGGYDRVYYQRVQSAAGYAGGESGGAPTPLNAGLLQVTAQVQITYDLNFNPGDTEVIVNATK